MIFVDYLKKIFHSVDWILFWSVIFLAFAGLITMNSFADDDLFFNRQIIWILVSTIVMIVASTIDWRFLRKTEVVTALYFLAFASLFLLFFFGSTFKGARSWFDLGFFAFQPVDFAKMVVIFVLAKYFSRRHIEIANVRHILVSGFYVIVIFLLVFLQPDFGSSIIFFFIWLSMVLFSGISKKHLLFVFASGALIFSFLWFFIFYDYQKTRIISFLNHLADIKGAGYSAYQSMVAVGSGEIFGKGIGMGSQSKLRFLPEYETDFIFAAYSEEWGFVGVLILFGLYGATFWRIVYISRKGSTNFEVFYGLGLSSFLLSHFIIHVGMNVGMLPVTGITMPFMSYGGSHLLASFLALGILMGQKNYARVAHKEVTKNEIIGAV